MSRKRKITIDFNTWCTQKELAKITKAKLTTVNNRVKRKSIETMEIPELGLTLVRRDAVVGRAYTKKKK